MELDAFWPDAETRSGEMAGKKTVNDPQTKITCFKVFSARRKERPDTGFTVSAVYYDVQENLCFKDQGYNLKGT